MVNICTAFGNIISLDCINHLVFITEKECVFCEVETEIFTTLQLIIYYIITIITIITILLYYYYTIIFTILTNIYYLYKVKQRTT
jgi:hypothetical protein